MDRIIVYPGAIPLDTDMLNINRSTQAALHGLIAAALGTASTVDGLTVSATVAPSMNIVVSAGSITALGPVDASAYGSLAADTADAVVKMGVSLQPVTLTLSAPVFPGNAIAYLVQAGFSESDQNPVVLPYYNAANPAMPYLGPSNSGAAQNTLRAQRVLVQLKAGTPAALGSQLTPSPDAGFVALASVVTVSTTTQINAGDIVAAPGLRSASWKLPDLRPGYAFAGAFTSSGNFVVPSGVTRVRLTVIGGGGAGGFHATQPGGGGGAGGRGEHWVSGLTPGASIAVTAGAAGVPAGGAGAGGNGGSSSFGAYCSAAGGYGGGGGVGAGLPAGGAGGAVSGAAVYFYGGYGGDAYAASGRGGDGAGPGNGKGGSGSAPGANALGFGGGGGGGSVGNAGGAGGGGLVIVEY